MSFKTLVSAVSVQCQEIKQALASISYFETWNAEVVAECCRVSSIAEYPTDKIILGPGTGTSHTVYFILEGVCRMVQNVLVEVKTNSRQKTLHKVYRLSDSKSLNSKSTNEGYSSRLFNRFQVDKDIKISSPCEKAKNDEMTKVHSDGETEEEEEKEKDRMAEAEDVNAEEANEAADSSALPEMLSRNESQAEIPTNAKGKSGEGNPETEAKSERGSNPGFEQEPGSESMNPSEEEAKEEVVFEADHHLKILEECRKRGKEWTWVCQKASLPEKPKNVECFFVQTGFLYKGACFGLEKCQDENFIMSMTKVKCLKIPRRFLFKHNPCYTWNRIRLYHSLYLPKDEEIFQSVRSDRMWVKTKEKQSSEIASSTNIPNYTLINEVPYSTRLSDFR